MASTLYICYFGLREPLVQTQVLPYLREIRKDDIDVSILTFEPDLESKWTKDQIAKERAALATEGIDWHCLKYHKWPSTPATAYDILNGIRLVVMLARKKAVEIYHVRGHIPAPIGAIAKAICGGKMLFDVRGFMPEEYTDAGIWKKDGITFRIVKRLEKWLIKRSDGFIVLTENAREILFPESVDQGVDIHGRPVEVIPCCIDFGRMRTSFQPYRNLRRRELCWDSRRVVAHVGSLGGLYLTDNIIEFFRVARDQDTSTFALILTQRDHDLISSRLEHVGFGKDDFLVSHVSPAGVFEYLIAADVGLSMVKESYSSRSRSPTKIPEYLAAGLAVVANTGVGDVDSLIKSEKVGFILDDFTSSSYLHALASIDGLISSSGFGDHCRDVARRKFDLESVGGERYRRIYRKLLSK